MKYKFPDSITPIEGWKTFNVEDGRLISPLRGGVWETHEPQIARCDRHHAPAKGCMCGIHVAKRPSRALPYGTRSKLALARVKGWGNVIPCSHGWKAEYAYPSEIYTNLDVDLSSYGVPVKGLKECPPLQTYRRGLQAFACGPLIPALLFLFFAGRHVVEIVDSGGALTAILLALPLIAINLFTAAVFIGLSVVMMGKFLTLFD